MKDWLIEAANEQNARRNRVSAIQSKLGLLWENICREIERVVRRYNGIQPGFLLEFSGCQNHTVEVAVFESSAPPPRGPKREAIKFELHESAAQVRVRSSLAEDKIFSVDLNANGEAILRYQDREVSIERFAEIALRDSLFPPDA
jgi:hypothetical protein